MEFKDGMVVDLMEDGKGDGEEGWTKGKRGGMEIGEGEGRTEKTGAVLGCFFMDEDGGGDEKESWVKDVWIDTGAELTVR